MKNCLRVVSATVREAASALVFAAATLTSTWVCWRHANAWAHVAKVGKLARGISLAVIAVSLSGCNLKPVDEMKTSEVFSNAQVAALVKAAEQGNVAEIDRLVAAGANVNAVGRSGMTPLLRTLLAKNLEGYKALLKHGADPNLLDNRGRAVVNEAACEHDSRWLSLAIEYGANPNLVNKGNPYAPGSTPLFYAINTGTAENVRILAVAGANLNHERERDRTPLRIAVRDLHFEKARVLVEAGADFNARDSNGETVISFLDIFTTSFPETQRKVDELKDALRAKGVKFKGDPEKE